MGGLLIFGLVAAYIVGLFALAWWSERNRRITRPAVRAAIYGLSIAVYTGSWIYFSTIGAAARTGWGFLTTYGGPILAVTIFFPVMMRIAHIVKRDNIVSIADFVSSRYGKSRTLATLVTSFALLVSLPFIAQQLRAMSMAWSLVTHTENSSIVVFTFAAIMAGFVILFGARKPTLTEHNSGLVRVIAAESVFKIGMLLIVAVLSLVVIFRYMPEAEWRQNLGGLSEPISITLATLTGSLVAISGLLFAPRQFYLGFVQLERIEDMKAGRWVLVGYLLAACFLILPIVVAGTMAFHGQGSDMYVLQLPQRFGGNLMTVLVFLGAFSCVAAPIMVEAVALSGMITNELALPVIARSGWIGNRGQNIGRFIVRLRRINICLLLLLGWLYAHFMKQDVSLGSMGLVMSFGIVQFIPMLIGGLYWRRGHAAGAIAGLCGGFLVWFFGMAIQQFLDNFGVTSQVAAGLADLGAYSSLQKLLFGLSINTALYLIVSLLARPRLIDRIQAAAFVDDNARGRTGGRRQFELRGTVRDLKQLVAQFLGEAEATEAFEELQKLESRRINDNDKVDPDAVRFVERILSGVVGASLARRVIGWHLAHENLEVADVLRVLDDAAQAVQFNRELLQTTLDHMSQGIYVADRHGRLVAWNNRMLELFNIPAGFLHVGQSVGDAVRISLAEEGLSDEEIDKYVELHLAQIQQGIPRDYERTRPDSTVLKVLGAPMPGGRYVTTYTDVTELRNSARALKQANERLEERVEVRTRELTAANSALATAKSTAERASNSQARFLAAASHDLLQPLHAARLFMGALREEMPSINNSAQQLANNADRSIETANRLLRALLNLSRLEVGGVKAELQSVEVNVLLNELEREFQPVAAEKGLTLRVVPNAAWVLSDPDLLRSVLQNLIGNAVRYTQSGAVLVGCRREGGRLRFEVRDSGPGIPQKALGYIFEEFSRLQGTTKTGQGAGLGLAIAERVCKLLDHKLTVRSAPSKGSTFSVTVPYSYRVQNMPAIPIPGTLPTGLRVLCVENDPGVLESMEALLVRWGVSVSAAISMEQALAMEGHWDVVLADYHLEGDGNGLDLIEQLADRARAFALVTADQSSETTARAAVLGVEIIRKPVAPASLRIFLSQASRIRSAAE